MRPLLALLLLSALANQALAQDAPRKPPRQTWEAQFKKANQTADGHLTLQEAKSGYKTLARHFKEIDTEAKGYVTENDVRAWHATQKHARAAKPPEDELRPRRAFQTAAPAQRPLARTAAKAMVATPEKPTAKP